MFLVRILLAALRGTYREQSHADVLYGDLMIHISWTGVERLGRSDLVGILPGARQLTHNAELPTNFIGNYM